MKKQTTDGLHNAFHEQEEHYEDQKKKRARSKKEEKNVTRFIRTKTAFFTTFTYISIVCWVFVGYVMYNYVTLPEAENDPVTPVKAQVIQVEVIESESVIEAVVWEEEAKITAYSEFDSCHYPTEDGKCLNAYNKTIQEGEAACPTWIKKGSTIEIEGIGEYTCMDKTAQWVQDKQTTFDLWMGYGQEASEKAIKFGTKMRVVKLVKK